MTTDRDRKLDALVETEVFGHVVAWGQVSGPRGEYTEAYIHIDSDEPWAVEEEVPRYSSSIADAWLVVERMGERDFTLALHNDTPGGWFAHFYGDDYIPEGDAREVTPARAICLAALRALKVEVPS